MRYNVAQLLKEPIGSTRDYGLDEIFSGAERFADHVRGPLTLMRTHQGVLATAELDVKAVKVCGRCLNEYPLNLSLSIEEEFFPMLDVNTGRKLSAPCGFEEARIDESHTIEVTEVLRQYVITVSPMKPLCRPDCAGLCQHCGVNLNQQECECGRANPDPRWRDLASLLQKGRSEKEITNKLQGNYHGRTTKEKNNQSAAGPAFYGLQTEANQSRLLLSMPQRQATAYRLSQLRILPRARSGNS